MFGRARRRSRGSRLWLFKLAGILLAAGLLVWAVTAAVAAVRENPMLGVGAGAALAAVGAVWLYIWRWRRRRKRLQYQTLGELLLLSPRAFEEAVRDMLHDLGYKNMKVTGGSGDLAADVVGKDPSGRSVVVQCKRYAPGARVGSPDIQSFIGMITVHHKAERGIFVTTAEFSRPAIELAQQHGIQLMDGAEISRIIADLNRPRRASS